MTHQGAACNAASVHFGPTIRRTDVFVLICIYFLPRDACTTQGFGTFIVIHLTYLLTYVVLRVLYINCVTGGRADGAVAFQLYTRTPLLASRNRRTQWEKLCVYGRYPNILREFAVMTYLSIHLSVTHYIVSSWLNSQH